MRLKRDYQPTFGDRPGRRDHGGDFGRVMTVVLDDEDAPHLAAILKAALGAMEPRERSRDVTPRNAKLACHRHRSERVQDVMAPWNGQVQLAERDRPATRPSRTHRADRREAVQLHVGSRDVGGLFETVCDDMTLDAAADLTETAIVAAQNDGPVRRHAVGELHE